MLRTLVIRFACLDQSWIQWLLHISPHLQDVQLIDIVKYHNVNWNYRKLLDSIPSTVQSFHLSMHNEILTEEVLEQMVMVCPESQHRTLWSYQLTPTVIQILSEQHIFLTTLDILWHQSPTCTIDGWCYFEGKDGTVITSRTLHELLCLSPILRHLRVLKAPYIVQNMDIYRRSTMNLDVHKSQGACREHWDMFLPGIWTCRDLNTLHLQIHGHGPFPANPYTRTRILYGYISVVCPRLTELKIESAQTCPINLRNIAPTYKLIKLSAGVCLLSRLKFLARLIIVIDNDKKHEPASLNWLCKNGRTVQYKKQRQAIVKGWQKLLDNEAQLEAARLLLMTRGQNSQQEGDSSLPEILGSEDTEMMLRLKDLGLLADVRNQIQQMDADGYQMLPYFELLSLGKTVVRSPEEEIRFQCKQSQSQSQSLLDMLRQKMKH